MASLQQIQNVELTPDNTQLSAAGDTLAGENINIDRRRAMNGESKHSSYKRYDQQESTNNIRSNKIALVFWALIKNNAITTVGFIVMLILDYILQAFFVLSIYDQFNSIPLHMTGIDSVLELQGLSNSQYIQNIAIFSYSTVIIGTVMVFVFKNDKEEYFKEKNFIFKALSLMMALLRSFLMTYLLLILTNNIQSFNSIFYLKFLEVFFLVASFLLIATITYFQAHLLNLSVPNSYLPWSETSPQPLLVENTYKLMLVLAFKLRGTIALRYSFTVVSIGLLTYKIFLRLFASYMFNRLIFQTTLIGETVILFALVMILSYLTMMDFYASDTQRNRNYLSQIHFDHQLKCQKYFRRLDKRMNKKQLKLNSKINHDDLEKHQEVNMAKDQQQNYHNQSDESIVYYRSQSNLKSLQIHIDHVREEYKEINVTSEQLADINQKDQYSFQSQISQNIFENQHKIPANSTIFSSKLAQFRQANEKLKGFKKFKNKQNQKKYGQQNFPSSLQPDDIDQSQTDKDISPQNWLKKQQQDQLAQNYKNQKLREKNHKNLLKHYFKHHLIQEKNKDYRINLLKIFFTIKIVKNNVLAHFLLFNFINDIRNENLISRNSKILHQKFFESILDLKGQQEDEVLSQLDLQKMLDLNQLYANFEQQLDRVADLISRFWNNLINEKDTQNVYQKGIAISEGIKQIQKVYGEIETKQGDRKEPKIYMLIAAFYKLVVFKNDEYLMEMQKQKHAWQTRKLGREYKENLNGEKGLLIANLNLRKPMDITFANKSIAKILEYEQNEMIGLKINQIMPQILAENHFRFINRFMVSGKYGLISKRTPQLMRMKSTYCKPVVLYLNVNHLNIQNMILMVEEIDQFHMFETDQDNEIRPTGYIILDNQLTMFEMTRNLFQICGLNNQVTETYIQNEGNNPKIDDLFFFNVQDLLHTLKQGTNDFLTSLKLEHFISSLDFQKFDKLPHQKQSSLNQSSVRDIGQLTLNPSKNSQKDDYRDLINASFNLKIQPFSYLDGTFKIFIVGIQKMQSSLSQIPENVYNYDRNLIKQRIGSTPMLQNDAINSNQIIKKEESYNPNQSSTDVDHIEDFDLSSQTSTNSSSSSSLMQKFNQYSNQLNSQKIPNTLKFVLQIVLLVILMLFAASTVTMVLTLNNFTDATKSIDVCNQALQRLNSLSTTRVMTRYLFNIGQGYVPNNGLLADEFVGFNQILYQVLEDMRINQLILDQQDQSVALSLGEVDLAFLSINSEEVHESRYISQAVMLYIDYGFSLIDQDLIAGPDILISNQTYFIIENTDSTTATLIEREGYFLIENSNQDLYYYNEVYAQTYNSLKQQSIQSKILFQAYMTWICLGIVSVCIMIIIPLFGRIQYRVQNLMKLFFNMQKKSKISMLSRVQKFKNLIIINQKNSSAFQSQQIEFKEKKSKKKDQTLQSSVVQDADGIEKKQSRWKVKIKQASTDKPGKLSNESRKIQQKGSKYKVNSDEDQKQDNPSDIDQKQIVEILSNDGQQQSSQVYSNDDMPKKSRKNKGKKKQKDTSNENSDGSSPIPRSQKTEMESEFNKIIKSSLIKQSFSIIVIGLCIGAYFLGTYFLSQQNFNTLTESINVVFVLFYRQSCVENVIHSVTESMIFNYQIFINQGKDEMMSYYQTLCYDYEKQYQTLVIKNQPEYLNSAMDYILMLESGDYCDVLFSNDSSTPASYRITPEQCKTFDNGLATTGLTNIFQTAYKMTNEIQIQLNNFNDTHETNILPDDFVLPRLAELQPLLDIIEVILGKPLNDLDDKAIASIDSYINEKQLIFILIYAVFIFVAALVLLVFLFNIFRKLKREMLFSNRLIYIIDFEETTEQERIDITQFLTKY